MAARTSSTKVAPVAPAPEWTPASVDCEVVRCIRGAVFVAGDGSGRVGACAAHLDVVVATMLLAGGDVTVTVADPQAVRFLARYAS